MSEPERKHSYLIDGPPGIDDYKPEPATADTEPAPAVLVDNDCFLCVGIPKDVPKDMEPSTYFYAIGFAEGVSQALRNMGYHLCAPHTSVVRAACVDRGINWGKPEPKRRIVG